jgi:hypothetical protein
MNQKSVRNRILLENYYLPGDLEQQIGVFVDHYNNHRYHESLNNVTPADVYFGLDKDILRERCLSPLELCQYILAKGVRKHGSKALF